MAKMDITDTKTIQEILDRAKKDKTAAADLLKLYRDIMLNEADLYLDDEKSAKNAVRRALNKAYKDLDQAEALTLSQWLNTYVQDECISEILPLEKAVDGEYTEDDEVPDPDAVLPSDLSIIKSRLRSVLKNLSPSERLVCVLKYRDQHSIDQIADLCNARQEDIKNTLAQIKKKLYTGKINLGVLFAMIHRLYPGVEETEQGEKLILPAAKVKSKEEMTEEERFNSTVQEIRDFFETKDIPASRTSDRESDDSYNPYSEDIERTLEMKAFNNMTSGVNDSSSSAKMIIAATMNADSSKKASEYDLKRHWIKRILLIVALAVLGVLIGILFSIIRSNTRAKPTPTPTPDVQETSSADEQKTEEPEETVEPTQEPEPVDDSIGSAYIIVTDLSIRTAPSVYSAQNGMSELYETYKVYEVAQADGYTWYRIGEDQWIADLQGQYVTYTENVQE